MVQLKLYYERPYRGKRLPISSQNPKVDGISLSPSRTRQILQIHRETRKQPHECPERGSVAHRSGLNKWHPGPSGSGGPFVMSIKMERSVVSQPRHWIKHSAPSSRSRTFAPAPSAFLCWLVYWHHKNTLQEFDNIHKSLSLANSHTTNCAISFIQLR